MAMRKALAAGVSVLVLCMAGGEAKPKVLKCASPEEVMAMQTAAIQQQLMDAALTCGDTAKSNYNTFQTHYSLELRTSDSMMLRMFSRLMGAAKGDKAYNLFKTELAAKAELRRTHDHDGFCQEANLLAAAALGPQGVALRDVMTDIVATDVIAPVNRCDMQPPAAVKGARSVVPKPNPRKLVAVPPAGAAPVGNPP